MGLLSLIGQQQRVQLIQAASPGVPQKTIITIDCSVSETHSRKSTATKFPIENGTNISDHINVEPFSLELQAIISDTPLNLTQLGISALTSAVSSVLPPAGIVGAAAGYSLFAALSNSKSRSVAAYGQLLSLQANKQPFDVITSLQRYPSMWIDNLSVPRDSSTGKALVFTLSLVQLIIVSPQTVNIQVLQNPAVGTSLANSGNTALGNQAVQQYVAGKASALSLGGVTP